MEGLLDPAFVVTGMVEERAGRAHFSWLLRQHIQFKRDPKRITIRDFLNKRFVGLQTFNMFSRICDFFCSLAMFARTHSGVQGLRGKCGDKHSPRLHFVVFRLSGEQFAIFLYRCVARKSKHEL